MQSSMTGMFAVERHRAAFLNIEMYSPGGVHGNVRFSSRELGRPDVTV